MWSMFEAPQMSDQIAPFCLKLLKAANQEYTGG